MERGNEPNRDESPTSGGVNGELLEWMLSGTRWVAFATDGCGTLTWWNDRLAAVTDLDGADLDGLTAAELFAMDATEARDRLCDLLDGAEGAELPVETADGEAVPCEFRGSVRIDPDDRTSLYVGRPCGERPPGTGGTPTGVGADIDERARHRRIVETIRDGVFTLDGEFNLVDVNRPLASMLGYDRESLVGMHAAELIAPDGSLERAQEVWEALQRDEVEAGTVQLTIQRADGERFPVEVRYGRFPLSDDCVGAVGVARDVTEREEREARLRDHRDRLARLSRIGDAAAAALDPVLEADSRGEIERRVCERLADTDLYEVVWVGRPGGRGQVVPRTTCGADPAFHEVAEQILERIGGERAAHRAFRRGEPVLRFEGWEDEITEPIHEVAGTALRASMAIPLEYQGTTHGVLIAYSTRENAFSEDEREALARLGRAVGFAISAVGTRRLVHAHERTELEFGVGPESSVLAAVSAAVGAECVLRWSTPATDITGAIADGTVQDGEAGRCEASSHDLWLRVDVEGVDAETVLGAAREVGVVDTRVIHETKTCCTVELRVTESVPKAVVDAGARTVGVIATDGRARVVTEAPVDADIRSVVETFTEGTDAELIAKRSPGRPVGEAVEGDSVAEALTEKQRDALRTAASMGYFEWPREHTGEEVAEQLGVSSATFHYHLRAAQATLFDVVLDATDDTTNDTTDDATDDE